MIRVMLVEDDPDIIKIIKSSLAGYPDYRIEACTSAEEALQRKEDSEVILLDIMLPGMDGISLCTLLRKKSDAPIIFLSCLDDAQTIVEALKKGGDDYLVKPFEPSVLHARIQANLRRVSMVRKQSREAVCTAGSQISVDPKTQTAVVNGRSISLLPLECQLFSFLVRNEGRCYKAKELYREVWGMDDNGNVKTVLVHMHNLRKKVEDDPENPRWLLNIRGRGYTFRTQEYDDHEQ